MRIRTCFSAMSLSLLMVIGGAPVVAAQTASDSPPPQTTMFPHSGDSRWWLSGQLNLIWQAHGRFTSPYQGDNSLRPDPEQALSRLWTIYTGVTLSGHTELLFDIESAGGSGLSDALPGRIHQPGRRSKPDARLDSVRRSRDGARNGRPERI